MRVVFGEFALDPAGRQLLRGGQSRPLEPKAFALLELLVSRRPAAVPKTEIRDHLWPDTFVSESNLTVLIAQIRHALDDDPRRPRFVRTVYGLGYAFVAPAEPEGSPAPGRPSGQTIPIRAMVVCENQTFPLHDGENVLGRDEGLAVTLRWSRVSRRHARIVVAGERALIEDLGSKNGTFLNGKRVSQPTLLADGDTFRLGRLLLRFQMPLGTVSTGSETGDDGRSGEDT